MPSTIAASTTWPLAGDPRLEQRGEDADHEVRRAAAEVADQVGREVRAALVLAEAVEGAGDRDVVHVVPGGLGERAVLAPAGHPAVDQARVDRVAVLGAEAEPLGDAGAHALDEHVGVGDQLQDGLGGLGVLEVERDAGAAAVEQVARAAGQRLAAWTLDADHVRPEVGQDHAGVRAGPDPRDLDDLDAAQRSGALPQFVRHGADHDRTTVTVGGGRDAGPNPHLTRGYGRSTRRVRRVQRQ